jgi:hypothetical protein
VKKENPMNGGSLEDSLREEGILEEVEAAAHQRIADLQKQPDDSDPPVWKRLHNRGVLKASPDESVWPVGKTTGRGGQPEALTSGCRS